jgi:hypothetical protein
VQFSGEPINKVLANRNLLQVSDDWMEAQADFRIENNIPAKVAQVMPEGIYNRVVRI